MFIDQHRGQWPIAVLCRVLEVTRAAYYKFINRKTSLTETKQEEIANGIKEIRLEKHNDSYGSPRMHRELLVRGIKCCRNTVAKCMKKAGISAKRRSKFRISTTDSNHDYQIAPNLLNQNFTAQSGSRDITYIQTREGFAYLCAFADLCSRKIVGWKTSLHIDSELSL